MDARAGGAADEALAAAAKEGCRASFEELVERYGGRVHALLERRLGDAHQALDVSQEVWVRVFRGLAGFRPEAGFRGGASFRPGASFRSWLFGIALNAARDEGRRRGRAPLLYLDAFRAELAAGDPADERAERRAVEAALLGVAEPFRTALVLIDVEGLSYEEAARALACAPGTVKSRVSRGRAAFRERWERAGNEIRAGGSP